MAGAPITITLYDENDEIKGVYTRSIVPWEILKEAIKLQGIDMNKVTEDDIDNMAGLVVALFGDKFSLEDLNKGSDVTDMMTVIQSVVAKSLKVFPTNPTPQA
jgi:hypothetical protein